ncbi:alcohol dehydrogenase catalytic domain-containing protein [Methanosarcina sp.]|uniref:alcohol dehydrogenase catalytic domain-containing protein n=1 Tax=Methanosarcina sp. TaxID=2213 RepID=UPI003BB59536
MLKNIKLIFCRQNNVFHYVISNIFLSKNKPLIIKILASGICGTDIDIARNSRPDTAKILGHESIGKIIAVHPAVKDFKENELVIFNPVSPFNQDKILGHSYDGIFQKFRQISVEELFHNLLIKIPENSPSWYGALLEPMSVAVYAYEIFLTRGYVNDILIIGTGAIAHVIAAYFYKKKCNITMISNSKKRVSLLKKRNNFTFSYKYFKEFKSSNEKFSRIISCSRRSTAKIALEIAFHFAKDNNTIIDFVNGFNEPILLEAANEKNSLKIDLNQIRRANNCGKNYLIVDLLNPKQCGVTGHRGSSKDHFIKALKSINETPQYYMKLIDKIIAFDELGNFFNDGIKLDLSHRGKILIDMNKDRNDI